jgi:hypothetical protein
LHRYIARGSNQTGIVSSLQKNINNLQKNFDTTLIKINEIIDNQQGFNTLDENNNYKKIFGSIKEKKENLVNSHNEANKELLNEFKESEFKEY